MTDDCMGEACPAIKRSNVGFTLKTLQLQVCSLQKKQTLGFTVSFWLIEYPINQGAS